VKKLLALIFLLAALDGCSGGGIMPSGPHRMSGAALSAIVEAQAARTGVSSRLISAVIRTESNGDPSAVSRAGAQGLMQLMPATAIEYGVVNSFDPIENVTAGTSYLHDLLARYHHNVRLALAAYNAGPGAVDAFHGIPPFSETRIYVARVTAALHTGT
jgi:soluble lytic murein transglycosylase-like protein